MDKFIYVHKKGEQGELERLNELLENGWRVMQMSAVSEAETYGCYVWIREQDDDEYLDSVPGMNEIIKEGLATPLSECISLSDVRKGVRH